MAKKTKKSAFKNKVGNNAKTSGSGGNQFGYLNLPKGIEQYSPKGGKREKIDIIPYIVGTKNHPDKDSEHEIAIKGEPWYKRPFWVHRNVGSDKDTVVCLKSFGEKCPICEYRSKRVKEGADKEELKAYNNSLRNLYYVIPRGIKKMEEVAHVFDMSQFLFQNLLNEEMLEDENYEVFPDLEEGLTLKVRWTEENFMGNKYAQAGRIDFEEREEPIDEEIMNELPDLDTCLKRMSYDQLQAMFFEMGEPSEADESTGKEDEDEDEDDAPTRKPRSNKPEKEEETTNDGALPFSDDLDWDELKDMDLMELVDVVKAKDELEDIDVDDYDSAEELAKAIAEELDIDIPKEKPKKEKPKKEEPAKKEKEDKGGAVDVDSLDWEELQGMSRKKLKKLIKQEDLTEDVDPDDYEDDEELAKAIAEELVIDID